MYFSDGTRRYNQFGVYANHSIYPNSRLCLPVYVQGKWRIGLMAVRDISENEEITWNYSDRNKDIPWLSGKKLRI
jgi:hypothetical protein